MIAEGPHRHPQALGNAEPALDAGDFAVDQGCIRDLTNLSGTFLFDDEAGLLAIRASMVQHGWTIVSGAVRFFPIDGGRPRILS